MLTLQVHLIVIGLYYVMCSKLKKKRERKNKSIIDCHVANFYEKAHDDLKGRKCADNDEDNQLIRLRKVLNNEIETHETLGMR